jgi:hypothetical protein
MCSSFLTLIDVTEIYTVEAYSSLCLTSVKCSINKLSGVEEELVKVHIKPSLEESVVCVCVCVCVEMQFDQVVFQGL